LTLSLKHPATIRKSVQIKQDQVDKLL